MKKCLPFVFLVFMGCSLFEDTKLVDIQKFEGPCIITLKDGSTIETTGGIEVTKRYEGVPITSPVLTVKVESKFHHEQCSFGRRTPLSGSSSKIVLDIFRLY